MRIDAPPRFLATVFGRRRRRDAALAGQWEWALTFAVAPPDGPWARPDVCLGQVVGHRQRARTGTKAWIRWWATGKTTAAWFEGEWPAIGVFVVATGSVGHGEHHDEPVFFVDAGSLLSILPASTPAAYERHARRQARRRRRAERRHAGEGSPRAI